VMEAAGRHVRIWEGHMRFYVVNWIVIGSHDGGGEEIVSRLGDESCEDQLSGFRGRDPLV
jgi:hypothetical protein